MKIINILKWIIAPLIAIGILYLQNTKQIFLTTVQPDMFEPYTRHPASDSWSAMTTVLVGYPIMIVAMILIVVLIRLEKFFRGVKTNMKFSIYNRNVLITALVVVYFNFFSPHGIALQITVLAIFIMSALFCIWANLPEKHKEVVVNM